MKKNVLTKEINYIGGCFEEPALFKISSSFTTLVFHAKFDKQLILFLKCISGYVYKHNSKQYFCGYIVWDSAILLLCPFAGF